MLILSDLVSDFRSDEVDLLQGLADDVGRTIENLRMQDALLAERSRAQRRLQRLEALWELAYEAGDLSAQGQTIVSDGSDRLGMEWGAMGHLEGDTIVVDFSTHDRLDLAGQRIKVTDSILGSAIEQQKTLFDCDQFSHEPTPAARNYGTRAIIATPFFAGEQQQVLFFGSRQVRNEPFDEEDIDYVELLAAFFTRTTQRRVDEARISFLQQHDPLTLLPNRARMMTRLGDLLARAERHGPSLALLLVDVDGFSKVNATHGFDAGDRMLVEISQRLILNLKSSCELFHVSGDVFAVIFPFSDVSVPDAHARKLIDVLSEPLRHRGREIPISVSIGMALAPDDGLSAVELEINAETALRRAKVEGSSGHRFYSSELDQRLSNRRIMESELRSAIAAGKLLLHYQPIIALGTHDVIALEALVRWPHAARGYIPPSEFIPIAEESDAIIDLGIRVMDLAGSHATAFHFAGSRVPVAINLSAAQFQDPRLIERLGALSSKTGPGNLEIELTESVAMQDFPTAYNVLSACKEMGFKIALDDFGTGHSSLTLLKRLPIDIVKIDRSFVSGLPDDVEDAAIARAVLALSRSLECEVRAEGVETAVQADWLRSEGCDSAQGYYFAAALCPTDLHRWMESWPHSPHYARSAPVR